MMRVDILEGGIYSAKRRNGTFYIVKILAIDDMGVYLRSYGNVFDTRPRTIEQASLTMEKVSETWWPISCTPVLHSGFLQSAPQLMAVEHVTEEERVEVEEMLDG